MLLENLADVQMGYPFRSRLTHDPKGNTTVLQMKDIDDTNLLHPEAASRVSLPKGKAHHMLRPGDLLFRSRGRSNGAALVGDAIGPAVLAAPMLLIRPISVLPAYLCWFINAPSTQALLTTMSAGTSVRMISAEALKSLDVPVPSPEQQHQIATLADLADREQTLLLNIAQARHRLITHLLTRHAREATP